MHPRYYQLEAVFRCDVFSVDFIISDLFDISIRTYVLLKGVSLLRLLFPPSRLGLPWSVSVGSEGAEVWDRSARQ